MVSILKHIEIRKPKIGEYLVVNSTCMKIINVMLAKDLYEETNREFHPYCDNINDEYNKMLVICVVHPKFGFDSFIFDENACFVTDEVTAMKINTLHADIKSEFYSLASALSSYISKDYHFHLINYFLQMIDDYLCGRMTRYVNKALRFTEYEVIGREKNGIRFLKLLDGSVWKAKRVPTKLTRRMNVRKKNKKLDVGEKIRKHTYNFIEKIN